MSEIATKPDWEYYGKLPKVKLQDAILLSLDIDPKRKSSSLSSKKGYRKKSDFGISPPYVNTNSPSELEAIRVRTNHICNCLNQPEYSQFISESSLPLMNRLIDIKFFGTLCLKVGISIPSQFPRDTRQPKNRKENEVHLIPHQEKISDEKEELKNLRNHNSGIPINLPYLTKELRVIFKTMEVVYGNNIKTKKEIMNIIDEISRENLGYDFGKAALKQLATVIVPDEVAEKERRSRKHPINHTRKLSQKT